MFQLPCTLVRKNDAHQEADGHYNGNGGCPGCKNLADSLPDHQSGRAFDPIQHGPGYIAHGVDCFYRVFAQLPDAFAYEVIGLWIEEARYVFLLCRDVDNVLEEFEVPCPEALEFGFNIKFFEIHGLFIQCPGPGKVEGAEAPTGKSDGRGFSRVDAVQHLLEEGYIGKYPVAFEADIKPIRGLFDCQVIFHATRSLAKMSYNDFSKLNRRIPWKSGRSCFLYS